MVTEIRHTGIVVDDLDEWINYFVHILEFKIFKRVDESGSYIDKMLGLVNGMVTTVKLKALDGNIVELLKFRSGAESSVDKIENKIYSTGITHMAFTVISIDNLYSKLRLHGYKFISPPVITQDNFAKVAFCIGPGGVYFEFVEIL